jgi:UDP-N-acetylmuramoyl-L-alanyl-D-glutamate--2,6-diaminopimelate ligase
MTPVALTSTTAAARFLADRGCQALRTDSRQLRAGDGFLAWPGQHHDARRYVPQVLAAGARACVVEADGLQASQLDDGRIAALHGLKALAGEVAAHFYGQPSRQLELLAVTGTNGKTSSAWWAAQALTALGRRCGLVGTLGIGEPPAADGAPATLHDTGLTTPDAVVLQAALADFVAQGHHACAIEASSIGIVDHRLAGCRIAVALYTNFTRDHLDVHGSMTAYWAAKRRLFDWPGLRAASINIDDAQGAALAAELDGGGIDCWTVSLRSPARLQALNLRHDAAGLAFDVLEAGVVLPLRSRLVGQYNASNLMGVIGALRALGLPLADIVAVVPQLTPVPGRLQPVQGASGTVDESPLVLVDYAHTPDALEQMLQALRPLAEARGGRLWCLFGCGGNRDASKRPLMGAIAQRLADRVVLTSDNPRDEAPGFILSQVLAGITRHDAVDVIEDRARAIAHAIGQADAADVVVLAGKGHEPYQEVAGVRRPFVDADQARRALALRASAPGATR